MFAILHNFCNAAYIPYMYSQLKPVHYWERTRTLPLSPTESKSGGLGITLAIIGKRQELSKAIVEFYRINTANGPHLPQVAQYLNRKQA